jgi:putative Mg2+ transporter-C (MgtC) family protein
MNPGLPDRLFYAYRKWFNRDPVRIAAQVVSGIGAGTIIKEGSSVKGLTTAVSLWVVLGIGLAIGVGCYFAATIATVLVFTTLMLFRQMEKYWLFCKRTHQLRVTIKDEAHYLHDTAEIFLKLKCDGA